MLCFGVISYVSENIVGATAPRKNQAGDKGHKQGPSLSDNPFIGTEEKPCNMLGEKNLGRNQFKKFKVTSCLPARKIDY